MSFEIKVFKGKEILPYIDDITNIRLATFSEFPYLYIATPEEERPNARELSKNPQGLLVAAFKENQICGFFSGIPLTSPDSLLEHYAKQLHEQGIDIDATYYGWEIIVRPGFQKQRWCSLLIKRFLQEITAMGFQQLLFVTCIREENHPLCPAGYISPESIWIKIGAKKTDIVLSIPWTTRQAEGAPKQQINSVACWVKALE